MNARGGVLRRAPRNVRGGVKRIHHTGLIIQRYAVRLCDPLPNLKMCHKRTAALWRRAKYARLRSEILDILGRKCVKCGFSDERALHIDHANGRGREQRSKHGGNFLVVILKELLSGSRDYQILCANCNAIKMVENNERTPAKYQGTWVRRPLAMCGTHASYHRGCRCELCIAAHREYCRIRMKSFKQKEAA